MFHRVKRLGFRARLFLILFLFALIPSIALTVAWGSATRSVLRLVGSGAAWDSVAMSGERAFAAARTAPLTADQEAAWRAHEQQLRASLTQSRRLNYILGEAVRVLLLGALLATLVVMLVASRVAGHLSRQLSRPIHELVGWTARIGRGDALPDTGPPRGAPEFAVLRDRMRALASEVAIGRTRAVEAERAEAFRETARQVAHELKNPLTPIRFAVERLRRDVPAALAETVDVLATEAGRLESMARSFAQFGRLPEGPPADVDIADLVRLAARAAAAPAVPIEVRIHGELPMVRGHYDALSRALSNVLLNAVEACSEGGRVSVDAAVSALEGQQAVALTVRDTGCGISPDRLRRIWEPYVTYKVGGTGLGLAIARQTVNAHGGLVAAESTPGTGTEVRFLLPTAGTPTNGAYPPPNTRQGG
ncbi:MAG: hypothetical protein NVS4B3_20960 [Gemmatimonadaceae bacterium]